MFYHCFAVVLRVWNMKLILVNCVLIAVLVVIGPFVTRYRVFTVVGAVVSPLKIND
jgi:hypothetical protein